MLQLVEHGGKTPDVYVELAEDITTRSKRVSDGDILYATHTACAEAVFCNIAQIERAAKARASATSARGIGNNKQAQSMQQASQASSPKIATRRLEQAAHGRSEKLQPFHIAVREPLSDWSMAELGDTYQKLGEGTEQWTGN